MQVLRDAPAMEHANATWPDRAMCDVLASHLAFWREEEEIAELANVILLEPGDTVHQLDAAMNGMLLSNPWAGSKQGDPGYRPCFETCEDHPTFIDAVFILSDDGFCLEVFIAKGIGIDPGVFALFAPNETPLAWRAGPAGSRYWEWGWGHRFQPRNISKRI